MKRERSWQRLQGGYRRTSLALNKAFNMLLGLVLMVVCAPLMLVLYVAVLATSGPPVLYRGERMGKGKKPFTMYKFRTLVRDAEKIIGPQLLTYKHKLVTPFGRYLRETRLDELPQLFNVLKGEMDFVGPRPERPQIYEHFCRHIRNYDRRFEVSPGLVGYSQLFTPHSSPKRIRVLIDNALLRKKQILLWDAGVVFFAGALVLRHTAVQAAKRLYRDVWLSRVMHRYSEKRETERIAPDGAVVMATPGNTGGQPQRTCDLIDLNDRAFLMRSSVRLASDFPKRFELHIGVPVGRRIEHKRAACTGSLYREIKRPGDEYDYVVVYEPVSPLNYYTVHQYFLKRSFA